jgi:hypothetical protein
MCLTIFLLYMVFAVIGQEAALINQCRAFGKWQIFFGRLFVILIAMKTLFIILLCLLSCLPCRSVPAKAPSSFVPELVESGNLLPGNEARRQKEVLLHHARKTMGKGPVQDLMEPELLALLLIIMVFGMMYTNPSR